jgi:hypothetical protein
MVLFCYKKKLSFNGKFNCKILTLIQESVRGYSIIKLDGKVTLTPPVSSVGGVNIKWLYL